MEDNKKSKICAKCGSEMELSTGYSYRGLERICNACKYQLTEAEKAVIKKQFEYYRIKDMLKLVKDRNEEILNSKIKWFEGRQNDHMALDEKIKLEFLEHLMTEIEIELAKL